MRRVASQIAPLAVVAGLILAALVDARSIRIGVYSQKASPSKATIGASIHASQRARGRPGRPARPGVPAGGSSGSAPSAPVLKSTSPLLQKAHPAGRGSLWYTTLNGLRSSASGRRARGLRIRSVSQRVEVMSIALDPSYLLATARVRESGRIVPYRNGHRLGRSVALNEVARVELHRVANTDRFVVWEVRPGR